MTAYLTAALLGTALVLAWYLLCRSGGAGSEQAPPGVEGNGYRTTPERRSLRWENVRHIRALIEEGLDPQLFSRPQHYLVDPYGVAHHDPHCHNLAQPSTDVQMAVLDLAEGITCGCSDQDALSWTTGDVVRKVEEAIFLEHRLIGLPPALEVDDLEERIELVTGARRQREKAPIESHVNGQQVWNRIEKRIEAELEEIRNALEQPDVREEVLTRAAFRHLEDQYRHDPPAALEAQDVLEDSFARTYLMAHAVRTWRSNRAAPDRGALSLLELAERLYPTEVEAHREQCTALCTALADTFEADLAKLLAARRDTLVTFRMRPFNPPNSVLLVEAHTVPHEIQVAHVPSWIAYVLRRDVGWAWVEHSQSLPVENLTEEQVETLLGLWTPTEDGAALAEIRAAAEAAELV